MEGFAPGSADVGASANDRDVDAAEAKDHAVVGSGDDDSVFVVGGGGGGNSGSHRWSPLASPSDAVRRKHRRSSSSLRRALTTTSQISAMLSNFATSYNVASVTPALPILAHLYEGSDENARDKDEIDSLCASSTLGGMVLGQILGGTMGDVVGRTNALVGAISLQIVGSLGSATANEGLAGGGGGGGPWGFFESLAAWRFVLGVGAGAVYPLAAVLSAEHHSQDSPMTEGGVSPEDDEPMTEDDDDLKDRLVAITFSTQGIGFLCVPLAAYPLLLICGEDNLDVVWRVVLGLGALPGLALLALQFREHRRRRKRGRRRRTDGAETTTVAGGGVDGNDEVRFAPVEEIAMRALEVDEDDDEEDDEVDDDQEEGESPADLWSSVKSEPNLLRKFLGTAGSWFLFDALFYGNTLFEPVVLEGAFASESSVEKTAFDEIVSTARDTLIVSLVALPGYAASIALMGRTTTLCKSCRGGRGCCALHQTPRYIQCQGFLFMSILYFVIGSLWTDLTEGASALLVLLYGLTFFFANYGPNTTTFVLPSLTYGRRCRSTLNGLSAAAGKAGALLGATMFEPAADRWGDDKVMLMCGGISLVGLALTVAFVGRDGGGEGCSSSDGERGRDGSLA